MEHKLLGLIRNTLVAGSTVRSYIDTRVYPSRISEIRNPKFPCVTIYVSNAVAPIECVEQSTFTNVEIRAHTQTQKQANEIYDAVRTLIRKKQLSDTNYYMVTGNMPEIPFTMTDPDSEPVTYNSFSNIVVYSQKRA